MKKNYRLLALCLFLVASCSKNTLEPTKIKTENFDQISKDQLAQSSFDYQIKYKHHHMKRLAHWVAQNKRVIFDLKTKRSNSNKIINDVISIEELYNISNSQKNQTGTNNELIQKSLNAFKRINNDSWIPVIFLSGDFNAESEKTFMAIEKNEGVTETFEWYEILDNELVKLNKPLTPESVGKNNLYVVELDRLYENNHTESKTSTDSNRYASLVLENMKIKDLKEVWPSRSEIAISIYKISQPVQSGKGCGEYVFASMNCKNYSGKRITRLKRKYKNKTRTYNFVLKTQNNSGNDFIYYVIFEEDNFPNYKSEQFSFGNKRYSTIVFRTVNSKYDSRILTQQQANNFSISNDVISYNLRLK